MERKTTKIADDNGVEQTYRTSLFPSAEGFDLLPVIIKMASGPLGDVVDSISGGLDGDVDGEKLGAALTGLAAAIIEQGSSEFVKRILKYTTRGDASEQKVPAAFDTIYQGNYGELFAALTWVLKENYAPFLKRHLGGDLSGLKARLSQKLSA